MERGGKEVEQRWCKGVKRAVKREAPPPAPQRKTQSLYMKANLGYKGCNTSCTAFSSSYISIFTCHNISKCCKAQYRKATLHSKKMCQHVGVGKSKPLQVHKCVSMWGWEKANYYRYTNVLACGGGEKQTTTGTQMC